MVYLPQDSCGGELQGIRPSAAFSRLSAVGSPKQSQMLADKIVDALQIIIENERDILAELVAGRFRNEIPMSQAWSGRNSMIEVARSVISGVRTKKAASLGSN